MPPGFTGVLLPPDKAISSRLFSPFVSAGAPIAPTAVASASANSLREACFICIFVGVIVVVIVVVVGFVVQTGVISFQYNFMSQHAVGVELSGIE